MLRSFRDARTRLVAAVLAVIVVVAACGSQASSILSTVGDSIGGAPLPAQPGSARTSGEDTGGGDGQGEVAAVRDGTRIVYTGTLSLQVVDLDAAVRQGREVIDRLGGYVGGSRMQSDGDRSVASFTYRIPSDRWEEALDALRGLGTVIGQETDAADVTTQIVDLEARIRNLRASEAALQRILEQATRVEDILDVERRLTDVRGQIEQLDAQRTNLEDQASYGTLTVTFGREVVAVVEAAKGWNPGQEVDRASATLVEALQALTTAGIWFAIVWLPLLLALLVVLLAARFVLRRTGVIGPAPRPGISEG